MKFTELIESNLEGITNVNCGIATCCPQCMDSLCPQLDLKVRQDFDLMAECGIYVCSDCGYPAYPMEVENSECPACTSDSLKMYHFYRLDDEGSFSWSACESCGSHLGGNRYSAHGFIDEGTDKEHLIHLEICEDCLFYHANGDVPEEE